MDAITPVEWVENPRARTIATSRAVEELFPREVFEQTRNFHRQIPGYRISPLRNLSNPASMVGVAGIWVKDESQRLSLNSFKVLGGSFAIYRFILDRLGLEVAGGYLGRGPGVDALLVCRSERAGGL